MQDSLKLVHPTAPQLLDLTSYPDLSKGKNPGLHRREKGDVGVELLSSLEPTEHGTSIRHPGVLGTCSGMLPG